MKEAAITSNEKVTFNTDDEEFSFYNNGSFSVVNFIYDFTNKEHTKIADACYFPLFEIKSDTAKINAYADEIFPVPDYGVLYCQATKDGFDYIKKNPSCSLVDLQEYATNLKNSGSIEDDIYIKGFMVAYYKM